MYESSGIGCCIDLFIVYKDISVRNKRELVLLMSKLENVLINTYTCKSTFQNNLLLTIFGLDFIIIIKCNILRMPDPIYRELKCYELMKKLLVVS